MLPKARTEPQEVEPKLRPFYFFFDTFKIIEAHRKKQPKKQVSFSIRAAVKPLTPPLHVKTITDQTFTPFSQEKDQVCSSL